MKKLIADIRRIGTPAALAILWMGASQIGRAQTLTEPQPQGWMSQSTMTGDWGGERSALASDGIKLQGNYTGQFGDDISGGKRRGHDYAQQISVAMDADLDKLFNWKGATFRININDRIGRGFSADYTGSKLEQNWAYGAGAITRLQWAALSQDLFNRRLNILVGYYSMGSEFGYSSIQANFLDNGINGHPQILPTDGSGGWDDYPIAGWGGRFKVFLTPDITFKSGVFEVNPDLNSGQYGFKFSLHNATGVIIPSEFTATTGFGPNGSNASEALVGHYTIGGYYQTGHAKDILHPEIERTGRHALYFLADQMVYRSSANNQRWISLFTQMVTADHRTLPLSSYFDAGVVFHGPFSARPNDSLNVGWVKENVNPRTISVEAASVDELPNMFEYAEQDFEANYCIQISPWLQLSPAVQYVVDPGAYSFKHYPNAFVLSMQVGIAF